MNVDKVLKIKQIVVTKSFINLIHLFENVYSQDIIVHLYTYQYIYIFYIHSLILLSDLYKNSHVCIQNMTMYNLCNSKSAWHKFMDIFIIDYLQGLQFDSNNNYLFPTRETNQKFEYIQYKIKITLIYIK